MQLLFLRQWLSDDTLRALGWTFIHSLWQGLIAALLAAIIIISTRKASAGLRYNLLGLVMLGFLLITGITFYNELAQDIAKPVNDISLAGAAATNGYFIPVNAVTVTAASPAGFLDGFINWFNTHADLFVMVWLLFFFVNCLKLFTGIAAVHRLCNYKTHTPSDEWLAKLSQLSKTLAIRQRVKLLQSELVKVPVTMGFLKPVILVPIGLLTHLPPEQVETILLHELAHIRRRDYFVNFLQRFTEAIFFFNPALLWVSSLIRQEREACCDDIVVANTTHQRSYLDALVSFQEYASSSPAYAMALSTRRHYLLERVKRMITKENRKLGWMERVALMAGIMLLTAFTFISQADMEEEKKDTPSVVRQETVVQENAEQKTLLEKISDQTKTTEQKTRTSVPVEPVKPLKLQRRTIASMMIMTLQPQDTTRKKALPVFPVRVVNSYKIDHYSKSVDDKANKTKEHIIANSPAENKKYVIKKLNGAVIVFLINNKKVPEKEFGNYLQLFQDIENARIANSPQLPTEKQWEAAAGTDKAKAENDKKQQRVEADRERRSNEKPRVSLFESKRQKDKDVTIDTARRNTKEENKELKRENKQGKEPQINVSGARVSAEHDRMEIKILQLDNIILKDTLNVRTSLFAVKTGMRKLFDKKREDLFDLKSQNDWKLKEPKTSPASPSAPGLPSRDTDTQTHTEDSKPKTKKPIQL